MEISEFPYGRTLLGGGLLALVCLLAGCAGAVRPAVVTVEPAAGVESGPAPEAETEPAPAGVFHRVLPGQTLWRIARTYGVDLARIAEANGIEDPERISAGQMVFIPGVADLLEVEISVPQRTALPGEWIWPVRGGVLVSGYGAPRRTHRHGGIDISGRAGQPVLASRGGRVVYAGSGLRGYGKTVILDHGDGMQSLYAHNSSLLVGLADRVDQGQTIARVGRTGNASANHCHFEIRVHDRRVDPLRWLTPERRSAR